MVHPKILPQLPKEGSPARKGLRNSRIIVDTRGHNSCAISQKGAASPSDILNSKFARLPVSLAGPGHENVRCTCGFFRFALLNLD